MFDLEFEITKESGTTRDVFLCRGRLGCMRKSCVIKKKREYKKNKMKIGMLFETERT